jgi:hypothetical protein
MIKSKALPQTAQRSEPYMIDTVFCSELIMLYMLLENDQITVAEFNYRKNQLLNPDDNQGLS